MIKITTKDIIKILPFEENIRAELLQKFEVANPDEKLNLEQLLWDTYDAFYVLQLQENIYAEMFEAMEEKKSFTKDFYDRIRKKTEEMMDNYAAESKYNADLAIVRKAMEVIVREIQAAKKK